MNPRLFAIKCLLQCCPCHAANSFDFLPFSAFAKLNASDAKRVIDALDPQNKPK
jgi:hypothetical protein